MSYELSTCPVCMGDRQSELYLAKDRHYGIDGLFRVVRCVGCTLTFLNPMFSEAELCSLYPADYYAYQNNFKVSRLKKAVKRVLLGKVGTRDPRFSSPGRMLDVGCGSGWFLAEMREKGWDTYGIEINASAAALGRDAEGLNIFAGTLHGAQFPSNYFDYVRSNHSFEHITNPGETLDEIHRLLRPEGKLFIGVPNIDSLNARLFKQYWWYLGAPVHPFGYSPSTLSLLLRNHNFRVESLRYNSDWGGTLGSVQIWCNRHNGLKSSDGGLINSKVLRLVGYWTAKAIDKARMGDAIEITASKVPA